MKTVLSLINTHLLASLTLAYIFGITASAYHSLPTNIVLGAAAASALFLLYCCRQNTVINGLLTALFLFFLTGLYQGTISSQEPDSSQHIYNLIEESTDVVAIGQLSAMPAFDGTTSQVKIALQSIRLGRSDPHTPAYGTVLLRLHGPWPRAYTPGSMLAIRAVVQRPSRYLTPGTFDYPAYLARQDIWITGFVRSPAQLHRLAVEPTWIDRIHFFPEQIRTQIGHVIDNTLPANFAGFYRAILLGDRSRIPHDTLEKFKASGTMHILAISGIHMTLIATLLFTVSYWLLRRSEWLILTFNLKKFTGLICLPLLAGYAVLAGSDTPVLRALIMSSIIILAFCSDRPKTVSALIALGALLILVYSPQALFTASFQLSFTAFISIMMCLPALQKLLFADNRNKKGSRQSPFSRVTTWTIAALLTSSAAVLGTAPLMIYNFHRFPLAGPLANLIIEPLICLWALPLGFLALPCMLVFPELATFLLHAGGIGLKLAIFTADRFQAVPQATLWPSSPGLMLCICYYCSFLYAIISWAIMKDIHRSLFHSLPFLLCLFLLLAPNAQIVQNSSESALVHILDVGHGSATLIHLSDGTIVLIDGGGSAYAEESVGQRIIAPFLWSSGITRLDTILLTHPDADHYNGIPFLLEHFSTSHLWTSTLTGGSPAYREVLQLAERRGVKVRKAETGEVLHEGEATIHCIVNTSNDAGVGDNRNMGLILQVAIGTRSLLFPGDIDSSTEKQLIQERLSLKSDILLAAHHGSISSNSSVFLQYVDPDIIIASTGRSRRNLFPSSALRNYCKLNRTPLLVTADAGTIRIHPGREQMHISILDERNGNPLRRRNVRWIPAQVLEEQLQESGPATPR